MLLPNSFPLRLGKSSTKRSLVERGSIRSTFVLQETAKKELNFSPVGYYDENTDIHDIHKYVMDHFDRLVKDIPNISEKISQLQTKLKSQRLQMIDVNTINRQIQKHETQRKTILSNEKKKEYLERAIPILENFDEIKLTEGPYFKFGENRKFCPDKLSLIRSFIQIASIYAPLHLTLRPFNTTGLCPYCRQKLSNDEEGKIICYDCDIYQDILAHDAEFSDLGRINGASNNNYMNRETFDKAKKCYQGQQQAEFPDELRKKFDEYCIFHKKNKKILTYETTRPIFKEIGFPGFYEDINLFLFMHPEIKRPLPNITEYEPLIDQDYDQFYQKFIEIKGEERDSGLNAWYVLYILLRRRKIPCNKCDFKMPDTPTIRIDNDNIARKVFKFLNWDFEDTI